MAGNSGFENKGFDLGSYPKTDLKPVHRGGIRRINGRQVNLLLALGADNDLRGNALLEFIEFECGISGVQRLEDVADGADLQNIVSKLKWKKEEEK